MVCGTFWQKASAQEFVFSQAGILRHALNPARVADMAEDGRGTVAYRNQWYAANLPYNTLYASAEGAIRRKASSQLQRIGAQLSFASDDMAKGIIKTDWIQLASSYTQNLDVARRHQLSGGLGIALQVRKFGGSSLTFDNQFSEQSLIYNQALASGENFANGKQTFVQVSLGAAYRFYASERFSLRADAAFLGLNSLNETFSTTGNYDAFKQKRRLSGSLSARYQATNTMAVEPLLYHNRQGPAFESLLGAWLLFGQSKYSAHNVQFGPGVFLRPADAIVAGARLEYDRLSAAITYDATTSQARNAKTQNGLVGVGGLGTVELSLQYRFWYKRPNDGPKSIPCRAF